MAKTTIFHTLKRMIIRRFTQSPLRLNRKDAEQIANEMVRIARKSRREARKLRLA